MEYGPGPPPDALPSGLRNSIWLSSQRLQTAYTDAVVGSRCSGQGYCSQPAYADTVYCACVNSVAYAQCAFPPCSNQPLAYKTVAMRETPCPPDLNVCTNLAQVGGSSNRAAVSQYFNCGGTTVEASPAPALPRGLLLGLGGLLLLLLAAVLALLYTASSGRAAAALESAAGSSGAPA